VIDFVCIADLCSILVAIDPRCCLVTLLTISFAEPTKKQ
jgi:hypothetical protein